MNKRATEDRTTAHASSTTGASSARCAVLAAEQVARVSSYLARGPPSVQKVVEISHRRAIGIRRRV